MSSTKIIIFVFGIKIVKKKQWLIKISVLAVANKKRSSLLPPFCFKCIRCFACNMWVLGVLCIFYQFKKGGGSQFNRYFFMCVNRLLLQDGFSDVRVFFKHFSDNILSTYDTDIFRQLYFKYYFSYIYSK